MSARDSDDGDNDDDENEKNNVMNNVLLSTDKAKGVCTIISRHILITLVLHIYLLRPAFFNDRERTSERERERGNEVSHI